MLSLTPRFSLPPSVTLARAAYSLAYYYAANAAAFREAPSVAACCGWLRTSAPGSSPENDCGVVVDDKTTTKKGCGVCKQECQRWWWSRNIGSIRRRLAFRRCLCCSKWGGGGGAGSSGGASWCSYEAASFLKAGLLPRWMLLFAASRSCVGQEAYPVLVVSAACCECVLFLLSSSEAGLGKKSRSRTRRADRRHRAMPSSDDESRGRP